MKYTKAFLAGFIIALGSYANVVIDNKFVAAFLFSFGLLTIIAKEYNLFTGKIYTLVLKDIKNWKEKIAMLAYNLTGSATLGLIVRICTKTNSSLLWDGKFNKTIPEVALASFLCGVLMYLAVTLYQKQNNPLYVIMPIMIFILSGFEHCVANMFYIIIAPEITLYHLIYLIINIVGNSLGSLVFFNLDKKSKIGG